MPELMPASDSLLHEFLSNLETWPGAYAELPVPALRSIITELLAARAQFAEMTGSINRAIGDAVLQAKISTRSDAAEVGAGIREALATIGMAIVNSEDGADV